MNTNEQIHGNVSHVVESYLFIFNIINIYTFNLSVNNQIYVFACSKLLLKGLFRRRGYL